MTTLRKTIVAALATLSLAAASLPAMAHSHAGHDGQRMTREQHAAQMAERFSARQAKLHEALKLSATQQRAWDDYQSAIKPQPRALKGERAKLAGLGAPERMQRRIDAAKLKLARMEARLAATRTFHAQLTPEQKKVFDERVAKRQRHGQRHHGARHHARG